MHPAVVHFPLVLVPVSFLLYGWGQLADKPGLRFAGRICLWLAFASLVVSVFTGAKAVNDLAHDSAVWELLRAHATLASVAAFVTLTLAACSTTLHRRRPRTQWLFIAGLAFDCLLVFQTGDLGARMVYLHGAAVKRAPPSPK